MRLRDFMFDDQMQDGAEIAPDTGERVRPFAHPAGDEFYQFDLDQVTKRLIFHKTSVEAARRMIAAKKIELGEVEMGYNAYEGKGLLMNATSYFLEDQMSRPVSFSISSEKVLAAGCRVPGCYHHVSSTWRLDYTDDPEDLTPCVHQIAHLLLLDDYIRTENPGDATDLQANALLHLFEMQPGAIRAGEGPRQPVLMLEPRLTEEDQELQLSFRIGREKLFVVKNLSTLVDLHEAGESLTLGKKDAVHFARETFREEDMPLYQLIRERVLEARQMEEDGNRKRYSYYGYQQPALKVAPVKTLHLFGKSLDRFFTLGLERQMMIDCERHTGVKRVKKEKFRVGFRDHFLRPKLHLSSLLTEDGRFAGVRMTGQVPVLQEGMEYAYYLGDGYLNRVSRDDLTALLPLQEMADEESREVSLDFGKRRLGGLYHDVLPQLEKHVEVLTTDEDLARISAFIPPEGEYTFFLDAEDGVIFCRPSVRYAENTYDPMEGVVQDHLTQTERDEARERNTMEAVQVLFDDYDQASRQFLLTGDEDAVFSFLDTGLDTLMSLGEVQTTDRFDRMKIRKKPKITVGVSMENGLMDLSVLSEDLEPEELLDVLYSYQEKRRYHRLRSGEFLRLDDPSIEELAAMMDVMHISMKDFVSGKMHLPAYRALYLDRMLEANEGLYADRDKNFRQLVREFKAVGDSDFEVPASLKHVLRNYQTVGFKWLRTVEHYGFGGVLADEMGLGKTLQIIAVLLAAKEQRLAGAQAVTAEKQAESPAAAITEKLSDAAPAAAITEKSSDAAPAAADAVADRHPAEPLPAAISALVVTPASLVYNWREEIARFAPQLRVLVVAGGQAARQKLLAQADDYDVLITSYDLLKRDVHLYEDLIWDYEILDEAQFIKTHTTAAAKAVKVIKAAHRFALTGTPIENRLSELWSIFDFLMPGFLYGYETFRKEFELPVVKRKDEAAMKQLQRMVAPFILRRLKSEVLTDLPDKLEEVHYVNFEGRQRKVYDGQVVRMKQLLASQSEADFARNKIQVLAELTRIRQICCDPSLLLEDYRGGSAKREAVLDLIQSAAEGGHKILLFSQFTSMLALLEEDLKKAELPYYKIIGDTPKLKRTELVRAFNEDDTPVFLISLKAGGTGLNLTGADIVIHYDPWWNLAVQNQATDRAHRIGQEKTVTVYRVIAKGTIEEKILQIQESKRALAEEILSGETGSITQMSREEILALL